MGARSQVERLGFAEKAENILWSYGDEEFSLRKSPDQIYLEYPAHGCDHSPGSIREECFRAARLISERGDRPLILYSGGIDSEAVLLSFHLQKLPFSVGIIDYNGLNDHDTIVARSFCDRLGVPYRVITRDLMWFWENEMEGLAKKVHCASPQVAALCWVVSQLDEFVVVGDGDSSLMRSHLNFFETKSERWALARWMLLNQKAGCPRFYQYTASLEASFLFEPIVEQFVARAWDFFEFRKFMYLKPFIFHKHFGCELRPKWTGFEQIDAYETYRKKLESMIRPTQSISWEFFDARKWALQKQPSQEWMRLDDCAMPDSEKSSLSQGERRHHLLWTEGKHIRPHPSFSSKEWLLQGVSS